MKSKEMFNYGVPFQQFYYTAQVRYKNYTNKAINNFSNLETYLGKVNSITSIKDQVKTIVEKKRYRRGKYITDTLEEVLDILLNDKG